MKQELGSDICECGEYRTMHNEKGCRFCMHLSESQGGGCTAFRFSRTATLEEQAHWQAHQPKTIQISDHRLRHFRPHNASECFVSGKDSPTNSEFSDKRQVATDYPNCVKCEGRGHHTGCDRCNNSGVEPVNADALEGKEK